MERLEFFCHNGHSLLCEEVRLHGFPSLKLLFSNGKTDSVVFFDTSTDKMELKTDLHFKKGELLKVMCPECKEELDNIAPCNCGKGSKFVAVYLNRNRSFNESVGLCNSWNCSNLFLNSTWKILNNGYGRS